MAHRDGRPCVTAAADLPLRARRRARFRDSPNARVETEELTVCGDRCIALLRYAFDREDADDAHLRAVDVLRVEHGKISEKLSNVEGLSPDSAASELRSACA
jgi:hypothetical protein